MTDFHLSEAILSKEKTPVDRSIIRCEVYRLRKFPPRLNHSDVGGAVVAEFVERFDAVVGLLRGNACKESPGSLGVEDQRVESSFRGLSCVGDRAAQAQVLRLQGAEYSLGDRLDGSLQQGDLIEVKLDSFHRE